MICITTDLRVHLFLLQKHSKYKNLYTYKKNHDSHTNIRLEAYSASRTYTANLLLGRCLPPPHSETPKMLKKKPRIASAVCCVSQCKDINLRVIFWTTSPTRHILERRCLHICQKLIRKHPPDNICQHGPRSYFNPSRELLLRMKIYYRAPGNVEIAGGVCFSLPGIEWVCLGVLPGEGIRVIHSGPDYDYVQTVLLLYRVALIHTNRIGHRMPSVRL